MNRAEYYLFIAMTLMFALGVFAMCNLLMILYGG